MEATIPRSMLRVQRHSRRCHATRKVMYRTRRKARLFAERSKQIEKKSLYVYRCHSCEGWHLTSQAQRVEAA